MTFLKTVVAAIAACSVAAALPALAEDKHDHGAEHGHAEKEAHYEKPSFASVKEAWTFMKAKVGEADTMVAEGKIEPAHEIGEQLEGAIHTLEEKSSMVSEANKAKLASVLKQLDKSADDLHDAAESKDAAAAALGIKKIKGLLPLVEGLYPAGALQ
jgi:predicted membrane-bound mannosyltransferase